VRFEAPAGGMRLLLDGQERAVFRQAGTVDLTLSDMTEGEHVVRLEKQGESQTGGGRFIGFDVLGAGHALPAVAKARQIEFIGDSYTVGYGNTSAVRTCTAAEIAATTDTQSAFGPRVARRFDADYRINAYSGFGIVRNYDGGVRDLSLPALYARLKPDAADQLDAGEGDWKPQVIVVNLGTNDFSTPLHADEPWADDAALRSAWRERYVAFLAELAGRQPQARFILMGGDAFTGDVRQVADAVNRTTPGLATVLPFGGLDLQGCDWHPSLADEVLLADLVAREIEARGLFTTP
ncbi:MAG: lipase, partial [Brevundimonas sp.]